MTDLHWFPYDVDEWTARVLELRLTAEDEGMLMRLYRAAWSGEVPATLRDDPDDLARILGAKWRRALPLLRDHFTPIPERPGLLRCAWLTELYDRQVAKHESYQARGRLGGRPKSPASPEQQNSKPELPKQRADLSGQKAQLASLSRERTAGSCAPTEHTTSSETTTKQVKREDGAVAARGAGGAARPEQNSDDPYRAAERRAEPAIAAKHAVEVAWGDEYREELHASVERWRQTHQAEYDAHLRAIRRHHFGATDKPLSPLEETALLSGVAERIRVAERWPSQITWISKKRAKVRDAAASAAAGKVAS